MASFGQLLGSSARRSARTISRGTRRVAKAPRSRPPRRPRAPVSSRQERSRLQTLHNTLIPRAERRVTSLRSKSTLPTLTLGSSSLTSKRRLEQAEQRLAKLRAERQRLAGRLRQRQGRRAPQITGLEVAAAIAGAIPPLRAGPLAALGLRGALRGGTAARAPVGATKAVPGVTRALSASEKASRAGSTVRSVPKAAQKAAGGAKKVARSKPARAAGRGARLGARGATFPIRRPIKTTKYSVYAQAPAAIAAGDPSELVKPFQGEGIAADVGRAVSGAVSAITPGKVASNLVKDVLDLPANTPPAIYMPIAGLVEAAQGDSSRLSKLWEDYKKVGLIPAAVSGDKDRIIKAITDHPLYAGLEASGARAVVGRAAGAAARRAPSKRVRQVGSQKREPLRVRGTRIRQERTYSPDLIEKAFQVRADLRRQRRHGGQVATGRKRQRLIDERADRLVAGTEGVRRANRGAQIEASQAARPRSSRSRGGVSLGLQGIVLSPETFVRDLAIYSQRLDKAAGRLRRKVAEAPNRTQRIKAENRLRANRQMRREVERLRKADPAEVFASVRKNAPELRRQSAELEGLGLLGEGQGARASLIPFARTRMGAKHGLSNETKARIADLEARRAGASSEQSSAIGREIRQLRKKRELLDADGNPLSNERILAEVRRQGGDPENIAFVTQQPAARGAGTFYRAAFPDRQTLPRARRTGKATVQGTFDSAYETILEQRVRNQGIIDATRGFDTIVGELGVGGRRFRDFTAARDAILNPRAYRLPKDLDLVPVRLAPFSGGSRSARRAEELFDKLDPADQLGRQKIAQEVVEAALQDGPGPVILLPKGAVKRLREHYMAANTTRRAAQLVSSTFKGTVLPTSPNWLLGNLTDVSMRSLLSGRTPWGRDARLGRKLITQLRRQDPEAAARLESLAAPGGLIGSAARSRVHRDARQFMNTRLAPMAIAFGTLRRMPGTRHLVDGYRKYRDAVFSFNDRFIERQAQYAQLGAAARREVRVKTGQWRKGLVLGEDAIRDLGKGLLKTDRQIAYAKQVEQVLGQWTSNGPEMRAFLVDYAPFALWARAASRFVFLTLPGKHPIKTGLAAAAAEATQEERLLLGLSIFAPEGKRLPANLQGSIPVGETTGEGVAPLLTPQSLTSFGYVADWPKSLSTVILPQLPLSELFGLDWTGKQLTHEDGTPLRVDERMAAVLLATGETYLPFVAMGKRIAENGPYEGAVPRSLRPYDPQLVGYLQSLSGKKSIEVDAPSDEGGGGGWRSGSSSSSGGGWR